MSREIGNVPEVLTPEEGHQLFDRTVQEAYGFSGSEFVNRWVEGQFDQPDIHGVEHEKLVKVMMLLPFADLGEMGREKLSRDFRPQPINMEEMWMHL